MIGRVPREDVAFPSAPDPRFGGNLARGTAGAQYAGASRDYYGGPSRGSPMRDQRYENYVAPRQVDYTRNIPQRTGTPNFRSPTDFRAGRGPTPNTMGLMQGDLRDTHHYPSQMFGGLGSLEGQQSKVNLMDLFDRLGGDINWNRLLRQMDERGIEYADMGGYGYNPDPNKTYDDIYKGTDIIDMEVLPGTGYGPDDEYNFDYKRNRFEDLLEGKWPQYAARGGLMSLRR